MLLKYLKSLKGNKKEETLSEPVPPGEVSQAVEEVLEEDHSLPVLTHEANIVSNVIDTLESATDNVVSSVLEIDTHGKRTSGDTLRQRILGRLPVLDRSQQIVGYELVLRNKDLRQARKQDEALLRMYDEMLVQGLITFEMDKLLGEKLIFISVSPAILSCSLLNELPKEGVVLAVKVVQDKAEEQLLNLKALVANGFKVALDDFTYSPVFAPFLRLAKFVRIDVSKIDALSLRKQLDGLKDKAAPQLFAKNVETDETFEACRSLSFNLFEGYYFTRLQPDKPARLDNDRMRVVELLNMVMNHAEVSELEKVFKHDAMLSYKLLRYINSPGCGLIQKIRSIAHALVMLGHDQLYRWLTLLLFTSGKPDPRSQALLKNALVRARLVEMLGRKRLSPAESEGLFIVGIFSLLDALLNVPMAQAVGHLNLPEPILQALIDRKGIYAPFLELAAACEEGEQDSIDEYAAVCMLDPDAVNLAHVQAMIWAEELDK